MLQFWENWGDLIWTGTIQTLTMTGIALVISTLIGLPLGTLLVLTRPNGRLANRYFYGILSSVINVVRSIPFIILLFFILPFTRFIMGTTIGVQGVLLPLIVFTAPYIARLMESALLEVDRGVVEAYEAMGISTRKIIWYVLIREARSSIVLGLTIATIGLIGATAMAGLVGAGGLGDIAYQYGHLRFEPEVMYVTIFVLILLVQSIQSFGNRLAARLKKA
ncbi:MULTISPECIES: methionine ABC transporter permease [Exiguobacterium]|jgi:D-methionine transport system permease protein|uniref:methionine ABC transporter permease n=2 Tax=Bacillales Family XII. Incertae Sedis TaxID=539742 RepID=UPI000513AF1E|nr:MULTISPECIES: methionine ABC transporter permease [Exiguobacterium]KGI85502.1 metal ABC transporter permease [Exiguobacterium mexicanum]MCT4776513.1 ABC transporter permease [Exiguobacterium aquaticum]MCT4788333.1 ABC transporter permease [Exiguobacterium mexicanum]TCI67681.1 ABC transporter permease [Exiguobacterium sp. IPCI3]TCI77187.1 ABC transporter permease [Exiguobacterium sp. IPCH1]